MTARRMPCPRRLARKSCRIACTPSPSPPPPRRWRARCRATPADVQGPIWRGKRLCVSQKPPGGQRSLSQDAVPDRRLRHDPDHCAADRAAHGAQHARARGEYPHHHSKECPEGEESGLQHGPRGPTPCGSLRPLRSSSERTFTSKSQPVSGSPQETAGCDWTSHPAASLRSATRCYGVVVLQLAGLKAVLLFSANGTG